MSGTLTLPAQQTMLEIIGCFDAAESEGLSQALAETTDERLKDLIERRVMHALYAARAALASGATQPSEPHSWFCQLKAADGSVLRSEYMPAKYGPLKGDHGIAGCNWLCDPLYLATPAPSDAQIAPEVWSNVWDEFRPPLSDVVARMRKVRGASNLGLTFVNDLNQLVDAVEQMLQALEKRKA